MFKPVQPINKKRNLREFM